MKIKEKGWGWKLTFPFAHNNYTFWCDTLYYPKGKEPTSQIVAHESHHAAQVREHGSFKFHFLYLFALPILWNPWRAKWEREAYKADGLSDEVIDKLLSSYAYGWLRNKRKDG